jgi:hypothetical protein
MSRNRTVSATLSVQNRTKVGNGTRLLANIDYRSTLGRRFRELVEGYCAEFETTSNIDVDLIKQAAGLVIASEQMTEATVRGERVDPDAVIKMAGQLRRVLADLKRRSQSSATPAPSSLFDHYAQRQDAEDENAEEEA